MLFATTGLATTGGTLTVDGTGGNAGGTTASVSNIGVQLNSAGVIRATGTNAATITGLGGQSAGSSNYGVNVTGAGSIIETTGADLVVTGTGGGATAQAPAARRRVCW